MTDAPGFHCEAKLHGFRRTADGVVVSFVLHPAEVPSALALDPLGTRYMLALAEIDDDENPIGLEQQSSQRQPMSQSGEIKAAAERPGVENGHSPTARARASELAKERYAAMPPMEQARERARILARDERFQAWAYEHIHGAAEYGLAGFTSEGAADFIREHCCESRSRALIAEDPEAYRKFLALERLFHEAIGVIPYMRS